MQKKPLEKNQKKYGKDWIGFVIQGILKVKNLTKAQKIDLRKLLLECPATSFLKQNVFFEEGQKFVITQAEEIDETFVIEISQNCSYKLQLQFIFDCRGEDLTIRRYNVLSWT